MSREIFWWLFMLWFCGGSGYLIGRFSNLPEPFVIVVGALIGFAWSIIGAHLLGV